MQFRVSSYAISIILGVAAHAVPLVGAADTLPEASLGFTPQGTYPTDADSLQHAVLNTLNTLSIPVESSSNGQILTSFIDGPSSQSSGRIRYSRYQYKISLKPTAGGTRLVILVKTQASSGPEDAPSNWRDVSFFNLLSEHKSSDWLYENVERTLASGSTANSTSAAASTNVTPANSSASSTSSATTKQQASWQPNGVDPRTLTLVGIKLGMDKAQAVAALEKEGFLVVRENYRSAESAGTAGSPFASSADAGGHTGGGLGVGSTGITSSVDAAKKNGEVFAGIEALDRGIAEEVLKKVHVKAKKAYATDRQGNELFLFGEKYGGVDEQLLVKDVPSLMKEGVGHHCSRYSARDSKLLMVAFSPATDKVIGVRFEQDFCDRDNLPPVQSLHDALFRRFPRELTIDTADAGRKYGLAGQDVAVLWLYDAQGRLMSPAQRQKVYGNAGFGAMGPGTSVSVYANIGSVAGEPRGTPDALAGNPDSLAASMLGIQLVDVEGFFKFGDELVAATKSLHDSTQKTDAASSNKKLDKNINRVTF